jgi:hypothetical protein
MTTPAETAAAAGSSYNYYPRTMIRLCEASYQPTFQDITNAVDELGLSCVWGPAQLVSITGESYSLAFVAFRPDPQEYTVVIRGTNMDSLEDFITEDAEIGHTEPFTNLVPSAPAGARIARATQNGINDLLSLVDPATNIGLVPFLQSVQPRYLYVTGHSLGGTLTPPMFAYLKSVLPVPMANWSFAGLTAGNADFNAYYNSLFNPDFPWRLYNTLDIAPLCWWNQAGIETIYDGHYRYGEPEKTVFNALFTLAAGQGYAQPEFGAAPMHGFYKHKSGFLAWTDEASHQHNPSTYKTLVDIAYPE